MELDIAGVRRALNEWAFRAKHLPGSEQFNTSEELFSSVRPDEEVVVYCTSVDCHASLALYHELVAGTIETFGDMKEGSPNGRRPGCRSRGSGRRAGRLLDLKIDRWI